MRIVLLISSLGPGGAERVMSLLADGLVARGHDVSLITLAPAGADFFSINPQVRRVGLGLLGDSSGAARGARANLLRVRALRRQIRATRAEVVLSFMTQLNVLAILACACLSVRVVVSERVDPLAHPEPALWAALRRLLYPRAAAVVVQTEAAAIWFRQWMSGRVTVIPNPVVFHERRTDATVPVTVPKPFMLAAGRLVAQKGFDILLHAFALIARELPQLQLAIAGDGPEAAQLHAMIAESRLENRVLLMGTVKSLPALMQQAQGFILPSRYEGFPNVLLEALAAGLPVVATDCRSGPSEILGNGAFGLLVPKESPVALAAAMRRLATDIELRTRLSARASDALVPYALPRILGRWESVLSQTQPHES